MLHLSSALGYAFVAILSISDAYKNFGSAPTSKMWNETHIDRLKHDLLIGYDKYVRPSYTDDATVVDVTLGVRQLSIDVKSKIFTLTGFIHMVWEDKKLTWDPSKHETITELKMSYFEIWQPDIVLINSADPVDALTQFDSTMLSVQMNGTVQWIPHVVLRARCGVNLRLWPLDTHECKIQLGSWIHDASKITLHPPKAHNVDLKVAVKEWEVQLVTLSRFAMPDCCSGYVSVEFAFSLQRRPGSYRTLVRAPAHVSVLLCLASFWLPARSPQRLALACLNILIITAAFAYIGFSIPLYADPLPLVVVLYLCLLLLVGLSVALTAAVALLPRLGPSLAHLPHGVTRLLTGRLGRVLLLPDAEEQVEEQLIEREPSVRDQERDWQLLATATDRMMFLAYSVVLTAVYLGC